MNDPLESARMAEEVAPPSFAQQRLWLLDRLMPVGTAYNLEHALRLSGELDPEALRGALNGLVRRHEVLRTRFGEQDGQPVQVIAPELTLTLAIEDLQDYAPAARETEARRRARAEAEAPFDLERGPLIRARLLRLAPSEHWLLIVLHHIVTDGWSSGVLTRELTALYGALHRGEASPLPPLPVQYADYALWQRQWLQGPVLEQQLAYWRQTLAGLPTLDLPSDRPRPVLASFRGGQIAFTVPEPLTRSLKELSRREGATLFMSLLAAFQVLLHRYSGSDDIAVGVPTAGRTRPQLEGLIGFFVNTLVLRGDLSGNPGFRQYLQRIRDRALDAYSHQDLPFEKLVEELAPKRDLSRNPLYQASLAFQNTPRGHWELPGLDVRRIEGIHTGAAKFDLAMSLTERDGELAGSLEYASDLFDAATIERMVGHFVTLLEGIVADPQCPIGRLPLLGADERHRLLTARNDTAADDPQDRCIHELFEQQAAGNPDAVAVVCDDRRLTYGELDARANRLAHHLVSLGVGPDVLVGICVERSLELVVGLLGILKAGGVYVPLDPGYPPERLAFMLEDTQAPVLLTEQRLLGHLPERSGHTLCLDRDWPAIATQPATCLPRRARATDLAYVIYTSGSTGTPKGVMVTHANVARLFSATQHWFGFGDQDIWTCFHSFAFDFSVWEIWGALIHGGRLVMVPYLVSRDPGAFHALLRRERVTVLNQTPSAFRQLIAADAGADAASTLALRLVIFGGEALQMQSLRPWLDRHGDARPQLVNMYGITETTVHVTYRPIHRADLDAARGSMIGVRIPDLRVYLLDRHLQPVPIGIPGELHVGGAGVAKGYLNRAELTADRFVADPFAGDAGARMYRSGDLARFTADGDLEYLGRSDDQMKIRGFRIEPGEIVTALCRHPEVREAAVALREDIPGDKRLVAYVVGRNGTMPTGDLRAWVKRRLPDYMVPAAFAALPALPLTPNGKVDRAALPAPPREGGANVSSFVAPRDDVELRLCRLWAEFLGMEQIGIDDNFFDAGGHSLLAARLFARQDHTFGRRLPLATLFTAPTVRELARVYRDGVEPAMGEALVPIAAGGTLPPLFAVPGVDGNVLCFAALARLMQPRQPFFGLQSIGVDGARAPLENLEQMAAHYLREMRRVQPCGPYYLLGACFGGVVAYEMTRQLLAAREQVAFLGLLDPSPLHGRPSDRITLRLPSWLNRSAALGRFISDRVKLYYEQIRPLGFRQRLLLVRAKIKVVSSVIETRDVFRGNRREFHQSRVHVANLRALLAYKHEPLCEGTARIEIFGTARHADKPAQRSRVDWSSLAGSSAVYHRVSGKDSGDMLQGDNAISLAPVLSARIRHARHAGVDCIDAV